MTFLTKSLYVDYKACDRLYFLEQYKLAEPKVDPLVERRMRQGNQIGTLAQSLFDDVHVVAYESDKHKMVNQTETLLSKGVKTIAEASFFYKDLYCACDFLVKNDLSYDLYEVKSNTTIKKEHYQDVAFQYYVLAKSGLPINRIYIVYVDKHYVLGETLDINSLMKIENVTAETLAHIENIPDDLEMIHLLKELPDFSPKSHCSECIFHDVCYDALPTDSLTNIYNYRKKASYYQQGFRTMKEILDIDYTLNDIQRRQIEYHYNDYPMYVDQPRLKQFLNLWQYPLYFLDFETLDYLVPKFRGTKPNQKLPHQVSIHIKEGKHKNLDHVDLLIDPSEDPRKAMIEFLLQHLQRKGSIIVYNAVFEKGVIQQLSEDYPQYRPELNQILKRIVDMLEIFRKGMVYNKNMGGSFSIKTVYPALCPERQNAYHDLVYVHNGTEAITALESLLDLKGDLKKERKQQLLTYCKLDTSSMVEIFDVLENLLLKSEEGES